ncbi:MAG: hypothetical protein V3T72_07980 [Thermoanaerobaculia bacterium]
MDALELLPPADPQSYASGRGTSGRVAELPRSTALRFAVPRAPLDDELYDLQSLALVCTASLQV